MRAVLLSFFKSVTALTLDLYCTFVGIGYAIGYLSGAITEDGIELSNLAISATFLLMAAYFSIFAWRGATPWQRVVGTSPASVAAKA